MKSRRRTFFRLGIVILILAGLGGVYLRVGLLPGSLKDEVLARLEAFSHKKVLCDKILYLPFRGLTFENISIRQTDGRLIFAARQLAVDADPVAFFREKKIVIRRLRLDEPVYQWTFSSDQGPEAAAPKTVISGEIDVPVAPQHPSMTLENLSNGPDIFLPENVYLEEVEIHNGSLTLRRKTDGGVLEEIRSIHVRMGFQRPPLLRFSGQVKLGSDAYATIDLDGSWDLQKDRYEFSLSTLSRDVPGWLLDYQQKHFLVLEQGQFMLKTRLWGQGGGSLLFSSEAHLKEAQIRVSSAYYRGHMHLNAEGRFDTTLKKFTHYKGTLELSKVVATNISPAVQELRQLSGHIEFQPDLLNVKDVKGEFKNLAFEATGSVRSFRDLIVDGRIVSRMSIERVLALLPPPQTAKLKGVQVQGQCDAVTRLSGSLRSGSKVQADYSMSIYNATVKDPAGLIRWTQVSGELSMDERGISVHKGRFTSGQQRFDIEGLLPAETGNAGWVQVSSGELRLRADYTLGTDGLTISKGSAEWPGLKADLSGQLTHWNAPRLQVQGKADIRPDRLSPETAKNFPWVRSLALSGALYGPFQMNGPWNRPMDWEFNMDAESPLLLAKGSLRFEDVKAQLRMKDRVVRIPYLHANFYGGSVGSKLAFDLGGAHTPFESSTYLNNVDLSRLGPDLSPPNKTLSGTMLGQLELRGELGRQETYSGKGALSVTKGYLFQSTQFKAMGNLPLVKVEGLDLVTFHELNSTFTVRNKKIETDDMSILGDTVNLSLRGNIHFDSQLDLLMNIQYSDAVYRGAAVTGGIVPMVLQQAGDLISQYRVRGTLKEPRYDKMMLPVGRAVGKKIGGLLQTIAS